jgi:hypothetical protein
MKAPKKIIALGTLLFAMNAAWAQSGTGQGAAGSTTTIDEASLATASELKVTHGRISEALAGLNRHIGATTDADLSAKFETYRAPLESIRAEIEGLLTAMGTDKALAPAELKAKADQLNQRGMELVTSLRQLAASSAKQ